MSINVICNECIFIIKEYLDYKSWTNFDKYLNKYDPYLAKQTDIMDRLYYYKKLTFQKEINEKNKKCIKDTMSERRKRYFDYSNYYYDKFNFHCISKYILIISFNFFLCILQIFFINALKTEQKKIITIMTFIIFLPLTFFLFISYGYKKLCEIFKKYKKPISNIPFFLGYSLYSTIDAFCYKNKDGKELTINKFPDSLKELFYFDNKIKEDNYKFNKINTKIKYDQSELDFNFNYIEKIRKEHIFHIIKYIGVIITSLIPIMIIFLLYENNKDIILTTNINNFHSLMYILLSNMLIIYCDIIIKKIKALITLLY